MPRTLCLLLAAFLLSSCFRFPEEELQITDAQLYQIGGGGVAVIAGIEWFRAELQVTDVDEQKWSCPVRVRSPEVGVTLGAYWNLGGTATVFRLPEGESSVPLEQLYGRYWGWGVSLMALIGFSINEGTNRHGVGLVTMGWGLGAWLGLSGASMIIVDDGTCRQENFTWRT